MRLKRQVSRVPLRRRSRQTRSRRRTRIYVEVGVRELNQRSLFGMFGVDLLSNPAHARVELQPALAGKGFLPDRGPGSGHQASADPLLPRVRPNGRQRADVPLQVVQNGVPQDFVELDALRSRIRRMPGTTLWGPTLTTGAAARRRASLSIPPDTIARRVGTASTCPSGRRFGSPVSIRASSISERHTCDELRDDMQYVDCWDQAVSTSASTEQSATSPWFQEVALTAVERTAVRRMRTSRRRRNPADLCTYSVQRRVELERPRGPGIAHNGNGYAPSPSAAPTTQNGMSERRPGR